MPQDSLTSRATPGTDLSPERSLADWSHGELAAEVQRLRDLVGFDERSYAELSAAVLALRDHNRGLAAEVGELRSRDTWTDEFETATNRHIKNLERHVKNLERHIQAQNRRLDDTVAWGHDVEAWAKQLEAHRDQLLDEHGVTLEKAGAYDRWMARRSFRLLLRARGFLRRLAPR